METPAPAASSTGKRGDALKTELGPLTRSLARRYFSPVRFPTEAEAELRRLHEAGFVVHVMRTTSWVNYLYLTWALVIRGLPPVRAVVNLRRWFSKPWRRTAQRGDFDVRFTYARRHAGSGLVFLKQTALLQAHGRASREDPFPALVAMARKADSPFFLVPELFVWEKWNARLKPALGDYVFGSPEAPGFLHSLLAFWRNHQRAQFRVGEAIDLRKFIDENPQDSDERIARKVRGALHQHLAKETRAVFGPPFKTAERVVEETMRDRDLRRAIDEEAKRTGKRVESVEKEVAKNLKGIAARPHPTVVGILAPILDMVFHRIYDGIEVDESGLHRAMRAASSAPVVLCGSHKSHIDYLVAAWVLYKRGYAVPLVAAGANLNFFPLGGILRRGGAFFLRRSFKGDALYTATFKAYVKKLVHDGSNQEFFPEGGRSRTGKLLPAKLGLMTWQVEAVLEGARDDLHFVPMSIDYEKVVEGSAYREELAGGEKKPEDLKGLLKTPKVLTSNYGRIHVTFDEPVSLVELMKSRGLSLEKEVDEEQKKSLVRALGHRVMYGISRVSTVTPHALVSSSLLAHGRRGLRASQLRDRIDFLRELVLGDGSPLSTTLLGAPSDPNVKGPIQEAIRSFSSDGMLRTEHVKGEVIYQVEDARRLELSFYKNTLMNLMAPRALAASALRSSPPGSSTDHVKQRALFLSRLFKVEFIYRVGSSFDQLFAEAVNKLVQGGLVLRGEDGSLAVAKDGRKHDELELVADMLRDYVEAYWLAALTLNDLAGHSSMDKKGFVKLGLETGRAEFLAGRIQTPEALSRTTLENAIAYFVDRGVLVEHDKRLSFGPAGSTPEQRRALADEIHSFLRPHPELL